MSKPINAPLERPLTKTQLSTRFKLVEETRKIKRAIEKSPYIQGQALAFNLFMPPVPTANLNQRFQAVEDKAAEVGMVVAPH